MHALQVLIEQCMYLGTREIVDFDLHGGDRFLLQPDVEPQANCPAGRPGALGPLRDRQMEAAITEQQGLYPFGFEAGMVIATTPAITQTRPIHAVEVRFSPRPRPRSQHRSVLADSRTCALLPAA